MNATIGAVREPLDKPNPTPIKRNRCYKANPRIVAVSFIMLRLNSRMRWWTGVAAFLQCNARRSDHRRDAEQIAASVLRRYRLGNRIKSGSPDEGCNRPLLAAGNARMAESG